MDKYRHVDDRVFTMTKNARVDDILAYIGHERLPAYVTSKPASCHKVVLTVRAGNWLHKDEPLLLQDSQASVANIQIGARMLRKSCKRRNLTARVRSI